MSAARPTWGLIGASSFASLVMIDAFGAVADGRIAAVFSASAERGRRFAAANGVARADGTLEALLGDPEIDAVYVSTTNELHADQVVAAAAAGKHVLCEKPLATTLADAVRMRDACRAAGVVLAVNHHMRCQDTVRAMRRLIDDGAIGDVLAARSAHTGSLPGFLRTWRINRPEAGAGVVLDLTVHDADTLRYLLADDIRAVAAITVTQGLGEGAIEDAVVGAMVTDRGTPVSFHDSFTTPYAGTALEVHGTTGSIFGQNVYGPEPSGDVIVRRDGRDEPVALDDRRNPYERGVEAFLAATRGEGAAAAAADDGIASLAVALATLESARSGRTVDVGVVE
jgi:1,5-anhydro-D-fructose reductase (1,5-anhydro-D-mannitol-forming)